jgi:hypothetical protein
MKKSGGISEPSHYKHYRVSSDRYLISCEWKFLENYSASAILGLADLELHASEGETTEFARSLALGFALNAHLYEFLLYHKKLNLNASLDYLRFSPDDEDTTRVKHNAYNSGGNLSEEWSELVLSAYLEMPQHNGSIKAGADYLYVNGEQKRTMPNSTSYSSDYKIEDPIGLFLEIDHAITDNISASFNTHFWNQLSFGFSAKYLF